MFSNAFVVGAHNSPMQALAEAAICADFQAIAPFTKLGAVEDALSSVPSCFFLFAPVPDISRMTEMVRQLRQSKRDDIRYAPFIYFCNTATREVIRGCKALGFDDVITMPFSLTHFKDRLMTHIDTPVTYCESRSYFGPERVMSSEGQRRGDCWTIKFHRDFSNGICIEDKSRYVA